MLLRLRAANVLLPMIFYVHKLKPGAGTPEGTFGITNRPDQLLHLVPDALGRSRGSR